MFFLLNDVILNVDPYALTPPMDARQMMSLGMETVTKLGAELYAADPLLHQNNPDRARRLASLILSKAPAVNAALFMAPKQGCSPAQVSCRYASVGVEIMGGLYARQQEGGLTTVAADREVWRRLAA